MTDSGKSPPVPAPDHAPIPLDAIPVEQGQYAADIFVYLPTAQRFVRYFLKGEPTSPDKQENLKKNSVTTVYIAQTDKHLVHEEPGEIEDPSSKHFEKIQESTHEELRNLYKDVLSGNPTQPGEVIERVNAISTKVLEHLAPNVIELKNLLQKNAAYLKILDDASALISLSVMFALAVGMDSYKTYNDLSVACVLMDLSLADFLEEDWKNYYCCQEKLSTSKQARVAEHPIKSLELTSRHVKNASEIVQELILNHHELFNGRGYPRKVRTEVLFPLCKVLSLAVDVFEDLKRADINHEPLGLSAALQAKLEPSSEAHLRRHSVDLVRKVMHFIESSEEAKA